jgi:hypothetical protein
MMKQRLAMRESLAPKYVGKLLRGKLFFTFEADCKILLDPKYGFKRFGNPYFTDSLRYLAGHKLTLSALDALVWRLAANVRWLRDRSLGPWQRQPFNEWVSAQIIWVRPRMGGKRQAERGCDVAFRVMSGMPCGEEIVQWWSVKRGFAMAGYRDEKGRGFGFSRRRGRDPLAAYYPFLDPRQFVTLRCLLLIEPHLCEEGPGFRRIAFDAATVEYNHNQQRYRARRDAEHACPWSYPRSLPCHKCAIGYDQCQAGTHHKTYVYTLCNRCKEVKPHDPADRIHTCCVACVDQETLWAATPQQS